VVDDGVRPNRPNLFKNSCAFGKTMVKNPKFSSPPWRHRHCADGTHALGTVGARPEPAEWCDNSA